MLSLSFAKQIKTVSGKILDQGTSLLSLLTLTSICRPKLLALLIQQSHLISTELRASCAFPVAAISAAAATAAELRKRG